jgi:putative oxidoreductase|tara:strand:- start:1155 stop:1571 length:417 start_codon:yes stop_codon:yes gene_type:complete
LTTSEIKEKILNDIVFLGLRSTLGVIFIIHGIAKFNPGFSNFLTSIGIPIEMQIPIALAELIPGVFLILGIFSRLSSVTITMIMLGAIFLVKGAQSLTGDKGVEFDLILLAVSLLVMITGPGRISLAQIIKKIPRCLH